MLKEYTLNFKLQNGIILIPVIINKEKGFMAFDTGAVKTTINSKYFENSDSNSSREVISFDQEIRSSSISEGKIESLSFSEEISFKDLDVIFLNMDYVEKELPGIKFFGSFGLDCFDKTRILIDYVNCKIILNTEEKFKNFYTLDFKMEKTPIIDITIGDKTLPFIIDTGANICLIDNEYSSLLNKDGILELITISNNKFCNIKSYPSDLSNLRGKINTYGIIGYSILKDTRCIFDFKDNIIFIER